MLLLLPIFFRVTPRKNIQGTIGLSYAEYCLNHDNLEKGPLKSGNDNTYYYCDKGTYQFTNCKFKEIQMVGDRYSFLIYTSKCNLLVENSYFTDVSCYMKMISCEDGDHLFTARSNTFINPTFIKATYKGAYLLSSDVSTTIFEDNKILFDTTNRKGIGMRVKYHTGSIIRRNIVKNGYYTEQRKASGLFFEEKGSKSDHLVLSDCIFTNCYAEDPSIMEINDLNYNLTITNITFQQLENQKGCIIKFTPSSVGTYMLTFDKCIFNELTCHAESCGAIGLWFDKDKNSYNIIQFKETIFSKLTNAHSDFGGGAISIRSSADNKKTKLIVECCTFDDIHTIKGDGGAICFCPEYIENNDFCSITVTDTIFKSTYLLDDNMNGQAIFIGSTGSKSNYIKNCTFIDCCNEKKHKYAVYLNVNNIEFSYNKMNFLNANQDHGCVYSSGAKNHVYNHNIFQNANAEGNLSAGIHIVNPSSELQITMINNTFDCIFGSSQCRCFMINCPNNNGLNIKNNTIQNCNSGGVLFQIIFKMRIETYTIDSFRFIKNSVDSNWLSYMEVTPQILILQQVENDNYYDRMKLVFNECYFDNNDSPNNGGAICYGKTRFTALTSIHFFSCKFIENHAKKVGGALSIHSYESCIIEKCDFIRNGANEGSGSIYIETDFNCKNANYNGILSKPNNINPNVEIFNCVFDGNSIEGSSSCISFDSSSNAQISLKETSFTDCGSIGSIVDVMSNVKLFSVYKVTIEFKSSNGCGGIKINSKGTTHISEANFIQTSKNAALFIASSEQMEQILVNQCLFDSCTANECSCFYFSINTNSFTFENNIIQKTNIKGYQNYIGQIDGNGKISTLTFKNVIFLDNAASSLYGGGTGMLIKGISELVFQSCNFTNNCAIEDRSKSRLHQGSNPPYYNGDGGAFQIGHLCETNEIKIKFLNCEFNKNKAQRHGGAIAVQTLNTVEIKDCIFDDNIANYDMKSSSSLLFDDHFYKKIEGRGGALYINPTYYHECSTTNSIMPIISISDCRFFTNKAYDGYAIYIEGDESETTFDFKLNSFNDNYNESNHHSTTPSIIYGAVITTEIHSITNETLKENYNFFAYVSNDIIVNPLSYVDHYGHTPSEEFTASDYFPSNQFSSSAIFSETHLFTISQPFSNSVFFSKSTQFSSSLKFSGSSDFSKTDLFSKSVDFTNSERFSKSIDFIPSSVFSSSSNFQKKESFTESSVFSSSETLKVVITKTPAQVITETPTKVITEKPTEVIIETPTKVISKTPTEVIAKTPIEVITKTPTDIITETPTDVITETLTKIITEKPTEEIIKIPTKVITETPTNAVEMSKKTSTDEMKITETLFVVNSANSDSVISFQLSPSNFLGGGIGTSNSTKSKKSINLSMIIGVVIGIVVLIVIVLLIIIFIIKRKRNNVSSGDNVDTEMNMETGTLDSISDNETEFTNPLYANNLIEKDPFDQNFDESSSV